MQIAIAAPEPRRRGFALVIAPEVVDVPAHPLPFKGKLLSGDPAELPPAVAMSLSDTSPVTFTYREELTHDDYHVPLILSAVDPGSWVGNPTGDIGVTAFASLSITAGDTIIGDYTAKEHVSKSYSLYTQPSHKEVDDAARVAVRQRIDQKIYADEARLAQAAASAVKLQPHRSSTNESRTAGLLLGVVARSIGCAVEGQPFEKIESPPGNAVIYVTALTITSARRCDPTLPAARIRRGSSGRLSRVRSSGGTESCVQCADRRRRGRSGIRDRAPLLLRQGRTRLGRVVAGLKIQRIPCRISIQSTRTSRRPRFRAAANRSLKSYSEREQCRSRAT